MPQTSTWLWWRHPWFARGFRRPPEPTCGCAATPEARRVAAFWIRAEQFRKRPWRLVAALGPMAVLLFGLGRLDLDAAFARISRAAQARVRPVRLPFPEAAIDVDRPADLALVSRILSQRDAAGGPNLV